MSIEEFSPKPGILIKELLEQPIALFNPHRFAIMIELYCTGAVDFPQLKHDLRLTDGALATHLKALANEELIESKRELVESRMRTTNIITRKGISAVEQMLNILCEIRKELQREEAQR